jgi:hypothetical protein
MFVLVRLSGYGYITESALKETEEISAHKLRLVTASITSLRYFIYLITYFNFAIAPFLSRR